MDPAQETLSYYLSPCHTLPGIAEVKDHHPWTIQRPNQGAQCKLALHYLALLCAFDLTAAWHKDVRGHDHSHTVVSTAQVTAVALEPEAPKPLKPVSTTSALRPAFTQVSLAPHALSS